MGKTEVVPLHLVPCGVCVCVCRFSGEAQQVLTGPCSSLRSPYKPLFFACGCQCVHVCQQAPWALCGSDVSVIDSQAVTGATERICGKRGTLQPRSFQP